MPHHQLRGVWLALVLLSATFIGTAGGVLAFLGGDNVARAVLAGGASFAAAVTIGLLLLGFAGNNDRSC